MKKKAKGEQTKATVKVKERKDIVASNGSLPRLPAHSPHISAIVAAVASFEKQLIHIASL